VHSGISNYRGNVTVTKEMKGRANAFELLELFLLLNTFVLHVVVY